MNEPKREKKINALIYIIVRKRVSMFFFVLGKFINFSFHFLLFFLALPQTTFLSQSILNNISIISQHLAIQLLNVLCSIASNSRREKKLTNVMCQIKEILFLTIKHVDICVISFYFFVSSQSNTRNSIKL